MVSFSDMKTTLIIVVCGVLGVVNAMVFKTLNDKGILISEFLTGTITITVLMAFTIIVWLFIGVIVAVATD